jgi:hypothetical protein
LRWAKLLPKSMIEVSKASSQVYDWGEQSFFPSLWLRWAKLLPKSMIEVSKASPQVYDWGEQSFSLSLWLRWASHCYDCYHCLWSNIDYCTSFDYLIHENHPVHTLSNACHSVLANSCKIVIDVL